MATNLETKVRCEEADLAEIRARAAALAPFDDLWHTDTYFIVTHGRLKLREITSAAGSSAELIAYRRPDTPDARWSVYHRASIALDQVQPLIDGLSAVCGIASVVRKRRAVAIVEQTRVHLDLVEDVGAFIELETVIGDQSDAAAVTEHARVIAILGLSRYDAVAGSYGDLAAKTGAEVSRNDDKGSRA